MVGVSVERSEVLQEPAPGERISDREDIVVEEEAQSLLFWNWTDDRMVRISCEWIARRWALKWAFRKRRSGGSLGSMTDGSEHDTG